MARAATCSKATAPGRALRWALERGEKVVTPPALLIQGTADENFPYELTDKFVAAYRAAGGTVTQTTSTRFGDLAEHGRGPAGAVAK